MKILHCNHCKKTVLVLDDVNVTPVCCGETMVELKANSKDAALEKHVPVVNIKDNLVEVVVGDVIHPMLEEHFIQFVILETNKKMHIQRFKPGEEPRATFALVEGEKPVTAYEYCNLHGLWKKDI